MNESPPRRLTRTSDRMIAGVAGGIAEYFDLDPTLVRLLWVVACFVGLGTGLLAYLIFWIVMPERRESDDVNAAGAVEGGRGMDASLLFGLVLVACGALLFFGGLGVLQRGFAVVFLSWPALLIVAGLALIFMRRSAAR